MPNTITKLEIKIWADVLKEVIEDIYKQDDYSDFDDKIIEKISRVIDEMDYYSE